MAEPGEYRPFDTSRVSPTDAAVTLRSLRRRFSSVLAGPRPGGRPDDVLRRRPSGGGLSAVEHAAWTASAIAACHHALRRVLVERDPDIALPPVSRHPPVAVFGAADVVALVGQAAEAMADTIAGAYGADWARSARTPDGPVSALDVARHAVRIGVEHLRGAGRALEGTT